MGFKEGRRQPRGHLSQEDTWAILSVRMAKVSTRFVTWSSLFLFYCIGRSKEQSEVAGSGWKVASVQGDEAPIRGEIFGRGGARGWQEAMRRFQAKAVCPPEGHPIRERPAPSEGNAKIWRAT
uniref:Uncharacterized protein n=1 Tax=Nelumbo nucifera TaxID=4432 RepID=A0A822ZFH7_NELNU|nr:TPA_asm: hypothetical protein HUJ06_002102 [Nelumbo nucifera]